MTELTDGETLDLRKALNEKFGTVKAGEIWFDVLSPALKLQKFMKNDYERISKLEDPNEIQWSWFKYISLNLAESKK